mmetsp:Transcript_8172/g.21044  ORF Transcript_8172/g.21044 Transcript_8172/m.21044 type:complete len:428 (+) Transcript_8172:342-1625(+)
MRMRRLRGPALAHMPIVRVVHVPAVVGEVCAGVALRVGRDGWWRTGWRGTGRRGRHRRRSWRRVRVRWSGRRRRRWMWRLWRRRLCRWLLRRRRRRWRRWRVRRARRQRWWRRRRRGTCLGFSVLVSGQGAPQRCRSPGVLARQRTRRSTGRLARRLAAATATTARRLSPQRPTRRDPSATTSRASAWRERRRRRRRRLCPEPTLRGGGLGSWSVCTARERCAAARAAGAARGRVERSHGLLSGAPATVDTCDRSECGEVGGATTAIRGWCTRLQRAPCPAARARARARRACSCRRVAAGDGASLAAAACLRGGAGRLRTGAADRLACAGRGRWHVGCGRLPAATGTARPCRWRGKRQHARRRGRDRGFRRRGCLQLMLSFKRSPCVFSPRGARSSLRARHSLRGWRPRLTIDADGPGRLVAIMGVT